MGYESMREFMIKDFSTFVLYNIIDTILIRLLDEKLKLINLMRKVCNIGLCEYENIFQSIPYILGGLTIQARKLGMKFLTDSNKSDDKKDISEGFEGAFVYPTKAGYYKNGIVSLDFNSLYPNVIRTLNLSSDTKVGKILDSNPFDCKEISIRKTNGQRTTISNEQFLKLLNEKCTLAPNNVLYIKPSVKLGIIPKFLGDLYNERVKIKKEMKQHIKTVEKIDAAIEQVEKELAAYKN
jgi:DNA polymerase elongation subunit (family B)